MHYLNLCYWSIRSFWDVMLCRQVGSPPCLEGTTQYQISHYLVCIKSSNTMLSLPTCPCLLCDHQSCLCHICLPVSCGVTGLLQGQCTWHYIPQCSAFKNYVIIDLLEIVFPYIQCNTWNTGLSHSNTRQKVRTHTRILLPST